MIVAAIASISSPLARLGEGGQRVNRASGDHNQLPAQPRLLLELSVHGQRVANPVPHQPRLHRDHDRPQLAPVH
jgi:hypothetical protein